MRILTRRAGKAVLLATAVSLVAVVAYAYACLGRPATCVESVNPHGKTTPPAGSTTLPGPKGGQNEDGFYKIGTDTGASVFVRDKGSGRVFGPFPSGTVIKYTQAPGRTPSIKKIGSTTGNAGAVQWHITGKGDALVTSPGLVSAKCRVPPPPK